MHKIRMWNTVYLWGLCLSPFLLQTTVLRGKFCLLWRTEISLHLPCESFLGTHLQPEAETVPVAFGVSEDRYHVWFCQAPGLSEQFLFNSSVKGSPGLWEQFWHCTLRRLQVPLSQKHFFHQQLGFFFEETMGQRKAAFSPQSPSLTWNNRFTQRMKPVAGASVGIRNSTSGTITGFSIFRPVRGPGCFSFRACPCS